MKIVKLWMLVAVSCLLVGCGKHPNQEGVTYLKEKKYEEALAKFQESLEKKENKDAYLGMGIAYYETERYQEAKEALEKAISNGLEPDATVYGMLGDASLVLEDAKVALSYYGLALQEKDVALDLKQEILWNQIVAYEQQKDYKSAQAKLKAYLKEYPEDEKAQKELEFFKTRKL